MTRTNQLLTDTLKLAIRKETKEREKDQLLRTALELLNAMTQTFEIQVQEGRSSNEDAETFVLSAKFLNAHADKKYDTREVERILDTL